MKASASTRPPVACRIKSPSRQPRLPRSGHRAIAEELHLLLPRACHLRPPGFLFQPTNLVPVEYEVHLSLTSFGVRRDRITLFPKLDELDVFDETLPSS